MVTFAYVAELWLEEVRRSRRAKTHQLYSGSIRLLLAWRPALRERPITRGDLVEFRNARADAVSVRSANRDLRAIRACLRWAAICELGHPSVQTLRLLLPEPPTANPTLTPDEVERVLAAATLDLPIQVILRICHATGLRIGEVLALEWADVDFDRGTVRVVHKPGRFEAKTAKGYRQVRAPSLVRWLDEYRRTLRFRRASDPVCQRDPARGLAWGRSSSRVHKRLKRVYGRAGVVGKRPTHSLRHTLATDLAEAGVPVGVAQRILGHASPELTLRVYTHATAAGVAEAGDQLEAFRQERR